MVQLLRAHNIHLRHYEKDRKQDPGQVWHLAQMLFLFLLCLNILMGRGARMDKTCYRRKLVSVTCIPECLVFLVFFGRIIIGYSIVNVFVDVETVSQQLLAFAFVEVWILKLPPTLLAINSFVLSQF